MYPTLNSASDKLHVVKTVLERVVYIEKQVNKNFLMFMCWKQKNERE